MSDLLRLPCTDGKKDYELVAERPGSPDYLGDVFFNAESYGQMCAVEPGHYFIIARTGVPRHTEYYRYENGKYVLHPNRTHVPRKRVLIGILTCGEKWGRQEGQLDTWIKEIPECCEYKYLVACTDTEGVEKAQGRDDVLILPCTNGDYWHLIERDTEWFYWALNNRRDWEWIIKTDDDTWIDMPRILTYMTPDTDIIGPMHDGFMINGVFYAFRRGYVEELIAFKEALGTRSRYEDVQQGGMCQFFGYGGSPLVRTISKVNPSGMPDTKDFDVTQHKFRLSAADAPGWIRSIHKFKRES